MTADEVLQLGVNVVELAAEFADQIDERLIQLARGAFGSCHVDGMTHPDLKSLADDAFGRRGRSDSDAPAPVPIVPGGMNYGTEAALVQEENRRRKSPR